MLGRSRCSCPPHPSWHRRGRSRGRAVVSFCLFLCLFPWCAITSREGRAEGTRGACNEPSLRGLRTGKLGKNVRRHDLDRSYASMIKQKKNRHLLKRSLILSLRNNQVHVTTAGARQVSALLPRFSTKQRSYQFYRLWLPQAGFIRLISHFAESGAIRRVMDCDVLCEGRTMRQANRRNERAAIRRMYSSRSAALFFIVRPT